MRPPTVPCATCPHTHPELPEVANFPDVWQAIRDAAAAGETIPCHESFPPGWEDAEDASMLRECAGVRRQL